MIDTLTPFKDPKYIPLEKALKQLEAYTPPPAPEIKPFTRFWIEEQDDRFVLNGVEYPNETFNVEWYKEMLDGGNVHNQDEWVQRQFGSGSSLSMIPSTQDYFLSIAAAYAYKDTMFSGVIENFRKMFEADFKDGMMTCTRLVAKGDDNRDLVQNYGYPNQTIIENAFGRIYKSPGDWSAGILPQHDPAFYGMNDTKDVLNRLRWATNEGGSWGFSEKMPRASYQGEDYVMVLSRHGVLCTTKDERYKARKVDVNW
jgi:hypothetical protein